MLAYFWGEDTYAARGAISAAAAERSATIRWLEREELVERSLGDWLAQTTGLFGTELVVVRDPSLLPAALRDAVVETAAATKSEAGILWDRTPLDRRSTLWRKLKPAAREYSYPEPPAVAAWLMEHAKTEGAVLERAAADMLVARLGRDRWRLSSELEKLLLRHTAITPAIVAENIPETESAEIFATLQALVSGRPAEAVRSVEVLLEAGHSEFYILSMLAYQFRTMLLVRAGTEAGQSAAVTAKAIGTRDFVVEKTARLTRTRSVNELREMFTRVLATDFAIKQGKADARTALLMLVTGLAGALAARASVQKSP